MSLVIELVGDKNLQKAIKSVGEKGENRIMKKAIRAGLSPMLAKAKMDAPGKTIKRLIRKQVNKGKNGIVGAIVVKESSRTIELEGRTVGFEVAANILEFGSAKRGIRAVRYMRGARETQGEKALAIVNQVADEALEEEWAKF